MPDKHEQCSSPGCSEKSSVVVENEALCIGCLRARWGNPPPSRTTGRTFEPGELRTRTFEEAAPDEISVASLSSNQITLPAGTYRRLGEDEGGRRVSDDVKMVEVPLCKCGEPMLWSLALSGKEWVCVPCGTGEPMFNGRPKVQVADVEDDARRKRYQRDLHVVSVTRGGGNCSGILAGTGCPLGICQKVDEYEFEFFGRGKAA